MMNNQYQNSDLVTGMIYASCITTIIGLLTSLLGDFIKRGVPVVFLLVFDVLFSKKKNRDKKFIKGEIIIEGRKFSISNGKTQLELPLSYKAIFNKIKNDKINIESVTEIETLEQKNDLYLHYNSNYIVNENNPILLLEDDIYMRFTKFKEEKKQIDNNNNNNFSNLNQTDKDRDIDCNKLSIQIWSYKYTVYDIIDKIKNITQEYLEQRKIFDTGKIYYITKKSIAQDSLN
jgi:hypothetical protein